MSPAWTRTRDGRKNGYTLLELLVVLAVLLLLIAAIPTIAANVMGGARFDAHSDAVFRLVQQAKYRARTTGRPETLSLIDVEMHLDESPEGFSVALDGSIMFFPNGAATTGVVRVSGAGRAMEIQVDGITGSIERRMR